MIDDDVSRCGLALIDPFVYQSTTKFYNSIRADVGGNVLTLTSCVLRSDRTDSVWMPTDFLKFLVHSFR